MHFLKVPDLLTAADVGLAISSGAVPAFPTSRTAESAGIRPP